MAIDPLLIDAPARTGRLAYGLLSAFPARPVPDPHWLIRGVSFSSEPCATPATYPFDVCEPHPAKSAFVPAVGATADVDPLVIEIGLSCATLPLSLDLEAKARRLLDEGAELQLELHHLARLQAFPPIPLTGPTTPLCALGELAGALAASPGPGVGVIWAPVRVVAAWLAGGFRTLTVVGGHLEDQFGNVVVATRADDGFVYAEAGGISVAVFDGGDLRVLDDPDAIRRSNDRHVRVEESWLIISDPCSALSLEVSCP